MQLIKYSQPKQLAPLGLLISLLPVVSGEMILNKEGLPTPWPIGIVGVLTSIASIFLFESEKYSFSWFSKLTFAYNVIRPIAILINSWNSFRIHGAGKMDYPPLTLIDTFLLLPLMLSIRRGMDKIEAETRLQRESINLRPIGQTNRQSEPENEARSLKNYNELKKIYSFRYLCMALLLVNTFWEMFIVLSNLLTPPNLENSYQIGANFITSCSEVPDPNSVYFYLHSSLSVACDEKKTCFLKIKMLNGLNNSIRGVTFLFFLFGVMPSLMAATRESTSSNEDRKFFRKVVFGFYIMAIILSLAYLVSSAVIQSKQLDVRALESVCDINYSLLSSKTGYLAEWWASKLNFARHIALL